MARFDSQQVAAALDAKALHLTEKDLARIAESPDTVTKLIDEFPTAAHKTRRQAKLLLDLLTAERGSIEVRKQAAGALIYLAAPVDLVPDDEEGGYDDDAAVIDLAVQRCQETVRVFCTERQLDPNDYFG